LLFEIYAEALTLKFLRDRGIPTRRIEDSVSAPDFGCELPDGRPYFVEVKALEIVGGRNRQDQIMVEGLDVAIDLERQLHEGKQIAMSHGVIAPYRKPYQDPDYDPRSLRRVIETLREKSRSAFKPSQFKRGPTFALAVADRLVVPGWKSALAPYYYDDHDGGCCVSGVIWQAAFGRVGSPVLRQPDFHGKPTLEGHLDKDGLYTDQGLPFPGVGFVLLERTSSRRVSYGLAAPTCPAGWTSDDTDEALSAMCDAHNDGLNTMASRLSRYEIEH
jgi:hypothetical protein